MGTGLFAWIDKMLYGFVSTLFNLILRIASVDIFTEETLGAISNRVYGILGIIILFKIILSCIQYLINPEKLSDKDNGIGQIIQRTVISFALLALIPTIFTFARSAQNVISATIPGIILGRPINLDDESTFDETNAVGEWMAMTALKTFISVRGEEDPIESAAVVDSEFVTVGDFGDKINDGCVFEWAGLLGAGVNALVGNCKYDYKWFLSIPAGVFLVYILLSMGIDVAIRSIKLSILELFAPISVASYIDSTERFKKWYQLAFKVYLDLFIRLIIIYFIVFMLGVLSKGGITFGGYVYKEPFINLYIIVALLLFAKSAPKFICDVLGLDSAGEGMMDMFTRPFGLAGSAMAAKETFESNWKTQKGRYQGKGTWDTKGAKLKAAASAIAGGGSAFARGIWAVQSGSKGFRQVRDAARDAAVERRNERIDRDDNVLQNGYTLQDYKRDRHLARIGVLSQDKIIEMQNKNIVDARQSVDAQFAHALKKEEDFKGVVRITAKPEGFGKYTNGDGNVVVANNISLAYARRMAKISEGEYYDDGLTTSRKTRILTDAQNDLDQAQTIYANAMQALKSNPDDVNYQVSFERAKADFERLQQRMFDLRNDANLGKARATSETAGEWDVIVRKLEKDIRSGVFADLLKKNDPDSVVTHEKTIESIKLLRDNEEAQKAFASMTSFAGGIDELIKILQYKPNGRYDIDPNILDELKVTMEGLVAETNREARLAEERSKRTAKAKEASKKS